MKRDARISIKITADLKQELDLLAKSYGLTISSLGAYIIGQWMEEARDIKARRAVAAAGN